MLICISDCVYFDIGLRQSIIQKKTAVIKLPRLLVIHPKLKLVISLSIFIQQRI